jgi:hypothetical protein
LHEIDDVEESMTESTSPVNSVSEKRPMLEVRNLDKKVFHRRVVQIKHVHAINDISFHPPRQVVSGGDREREVNHCRLIVAHPTDEWGDLPGWGRCTQKLRQSFARIQAPGTDDLSRPFAP